MSTSRRDAPVLFQLDVDTPPSVAEHMVSHPQRRPLQDRISARRFQGIDGDPSMGVGPQLRGKCRGSSTTRAKVSARDAPTAPTAADISSTYADNRARARTERLRWLRPEASA